MYCTVHVRAHLRVCMCVVVSMSVCEGICMRMRVGVSMCGWLCEGVAV